MTGFYATGEVATGSTAATVTDTTAPTLTAASATATGATTATGSVTTNESGGTLYWLVNASATATAAQVKAGSSKVVTAAGAQSVSVASLAASTLYYLHFLHADGAATPNESTVANTASFTTQPAASTVTDVTVTPSTATLAGGATVDFDWVVNGTNSPSQAVTVTTNLGTIDSAGALTAPAATSSAQTGTITVTSTQDPTKSGTATFTVAALSSPAQPGMIAASKVSAARRVIFSGGTRVVVFDVPSLQKDKDKDALMTNSARPYFKDGKWFVDKDPEEKSYYVADLTQELTDRATTATSVQVLVAGVKLLEGPSIQGSLIVVKLSDMDTSAGADNFWTARVTCANTEQFDRTTWLNRVDN